MACALVASLFVLAAWRVTLGFQAWTYEGAREIRASRGELAVEPQDLWTSLPAVDPEAIYIVDFIFTRCPTVCLALGSVQQQMQSAMKTLKAPDPSGRVRLLSISIDPHDDAEAMRRHGERFRADARHWRLLAIEDDRVRGALLRAWGVVVIPDGQGGFAHNAALHLIDGRGVLRGVHELDAWPQALARAQALASAK